MLFAHGSAVADQVIEQHETDEFCTLVVVRLRRGDEEWLTTVVVGGHPPPMLLSPGREPRMMDARGPALRLPEAVFSEQQVDLRSGDIQFLGWAAAQPTQDLSDLVDSLLDEVLRFQAGDPCLAGDHHGRRILVGPYEVAAPPALAHGDSLAAEAVPPMSAERAEETDGPHVHQCAPDAPTREGLTRRRRRLRGGRRSGGWRKQLRVAVAGAALTA